MEIYKIAVVTPNNNGYLDMWTGDGRLVPAMVPHSCAHMLRRGMRVIIHRNRAGNVVACSFGDATVFMPMPPTTREGITRFASNFRDIYEFSLDSIVFKYALRRSLRKMGMMPTHNLVMDIMSYNYIHNVVKGR